MDCRVGMSTNPAGADRTLEAGGVGSQEAAESAGSSARCTRRRRQRAFARARPWNDSYTR